jgi:tetratricopeptide (TPR) repeat protein
MPGPTKFVNRVVELSAIRRELLSPSKLNKIILIHGSTGVGKSALTGKVLSDNATIPGIKVRVLAGEHAQGEYINQLAEKIDQYEGEKPLASLQYFLRNVASDEMKKTYNAALVTALADADPSGLTKVGKIIWDRVTGSGDYDSDRLFRARHSEVTLMLFDYVQHIWKTNRLILNIENVQSIDHSSLALLKDLLKIQREQFVLLEYTPDKTAAWTLSDLTESLEETGSDVRSFQVDLLPFHDVQKLIPAEQSTAILAQAYHLSNGNLKDFGDLQVVVTRSADQRIPRPPYNVGGTSIRLSLLNKSTIMMLACIVSHQRKANLDLLHALISTHPYFRTTFINLEGALQELTEEGFITVDGSSAQIDHDWIAEVLADGTQFSRYLHISYEAWANLYKELFDTQDYRVVSQDELLYNLFWFYLNTTLERLSDVVDEVKRFALNSLYPRATLRLLERLRSTLTQAPRRDASLLNRINFAILDIYYQLGLFSEAFAALDQIESESPRKQIYRVAILDRLDRHEEAANLIEDWLSHPLSRNLEYVFYLKMVLMISYRSLNRNQDCNRVYQEIVRESKFRTLRPYPYFLRNAKLVLPHDEAVISLQNSVRGFQQHCDPVGEAHARLALVIYLIKTGEIASALTELDRAEELLQGRSMERHVVFNGRAIVRLVSSNAEPLEAISLLNSALRTITTTFERLAVWCNLLIANVLVGNHSYAEEIEREILALLPAQPDRVLHRSIYYNLAFAAQARFDRFAAEGFRDKAAAIGSRGNRLWEKRLSGNLQPVAPDEYLLHFQFTPVFIANWHVEITQFD